MFGGYYHQYLLSPFNPANIERNYSPGTRVGGFELGISIPLFFNAQQGKIQYEKIGMQIAQEQMEILVMWNLCRTLLRQLKPNYDILNC